MKARDQYLTGILLILIGVLIGSILTIYQGGEWINDRSEVKVTEVKRSNQPFFNDEQLAELDDRFLFKSVAEEITPTVVYIETDISLGGNRFRSDDDQEEFWDRFGSRRARAVGSGVIITQDGYILTNNHVVEDAVDGGIRVTLNDKRVFDARLVGTDPSTDLAVIKIDASQLPTATFGNSDSIDVGEWVLAIGNPFGLSSTVTAGIVSALSRDVQIIDVSNQLRIESFIQTDAAINRGNSGGPLVNTSGELIGINTAIASQTGTYQGYGFAVPSNLAGKVSHDLIEFGEVRRALLGVTIQSVNDNRAEEIGMDPIQGVEIVSVSSNGAAEEHGLVQGDIILSVNGSEVNESNQLQEKIAVFRPGDEVTLEIWRRGDVLEKDITLAGTESIQQELAANQQTPDNDAEIEEQGNISYQRFGLGFDVMYIDAENVENAGDIIIIRVEAGTEAQKRGLKEGFIIQKVDGETVEDLQSLEDLMSRSLAEKNAVLLQVETDEGVTGFFELKQ